MKKSFSSNSQLCHVWVQQKQDEGRGNNMFFVGSKIYSYGYHFLGAQIHIDRDGSSFALVRSDRYSSSTNKHLYKIEDALDGLMPYWTVPDVTNIKSDANFNYFNDEVLDAVERILKTVKCESLQDADNVMRGLGDVVRRANRFFHFAGFPLIELPRELEETLVEHLRYRVERYAVLNTPEMREKARLATEKKNESKARLEAEKFQKAVTDWRAGSTHVYLGGTVGHELLRVRGDVVQTSRGAEVPLSHALRLLGLIESGRIKIGERVGHFTLNQINDSLYPNAEGTPDKIIKIGCHSIKLSEAQTVLAPYRNQELKLASEA